MMIAADGERILVLSGSGDVVAPDEDIAAIGSGGGYALAAARALSRHSDLGPREIVERSMGIAAGICVFTNENLTLEEIKDGQ